MLDQNSFSVYRSKNHNFLICLHGKDLDHLDHTFKLFYQENKKKIKSSFLIVSNKNLELARFFLEQMKLNLKINFSIIDLEKYLLTSNHLHRNK